MAIKAQHIMEFAFQYIDIQIKKYHRLASVGVGPDAKVSAALIQSQVTELLEALTPLVQQDAPSDQDCLAFAGLMRFYLDCEYLRGRAGWLLDDNRIHNTVYERVSQQQAALDAICAESEDGALWTEKALSPLQQQYWHDSHAIAFRILDLVRLLKENPQRTDLGADNNLGHGLRIMRQHARPDGRYYEEAISAELVERWKDSQQFLQHSLLEKSTRQCDKETARQHVEEDRQQWQQLFTQFLQCYPDSALGKADHSWFEVATLTPTPKAAHGLRHLGLFSVDIALTAADAGELDWFPT
ncbi:MAG: hypothetical protein JJT82_01335 [Legionellaceae bacterium]|nr:hypothetical protein [Legionellaceae bacterium]